MSAETGSQTQPVATPAARSFGPGMRWIVFAGIALAVVALDQLAKLIVTANLDPGQAVEIVGDYLRIVFGQNSGALFGLFQDNALVFGIVSLAVIALIVGYHARSTRSAYLTITLGLLLGGALGNMLDRLRLGYVVDFVDAGIGATRFYTFNVADSAISLSILLLFVAALRPSLIEGSPSPATTPQPRPQRPSGPQAEGEEDPWDEDVAAGPGPGAAG
jgi:signal peptidase II